MFGMHLNASGERKLIQSPRIEESIDGKDEKLTGAFFESFMF